MKKYSYHYFYRIENLISHKFYYGIHSTNDLGDGYMGSGRRLKEDFKIYGKENFVKTILEFFKTREQASIYESQIVTEQLVSDKNCYNVKIGGDYGKTIGTILVRDAEGKFYRVTKDDDGLKTGKYVPFSKDKVIAFNKDTEKYEIVDKETYYNNKDNYIFISAGTVIVRGPDGKITRVKNTDEKFLSGYYVPYFSGKKHSEETKRKMSETHKKNAKQSGCKNSQYGTMWITNGIENKKIKKEDISLYQKLGWEKGRKIK